MTEVVTLQTGDGGTVDLRVVVLGGDIGAYSLARAFHEAYGLRPSVISTVSTGLVRDSAVADHLIVPAADDPQALVAQVVALAEQHPHDRTLVLGSSDWLVRLLIENRDAFPPSVVLPYTDTERLDLVTDKTSFADLCRRHDIPHPVTTVIDFTEADLPDLRDVSYPAVVKTADTAAYHRVDFPGKKKVFTAADAGQLRGILDAVRASGYRAKFLVQELIPGSDRGMRILTCYCDPGGTVRFGVSGRVLVEEHTPGALGNPAGIVVDYDAESVAAATRLLEGIGWVGYANFDMKYDPRTGRTVFFELNPRLGRSNFYLTASGVNPVVHYVQDWVLHRSGPYPDPASSPTHLYTVLPLALLRRYVTGDARRELRELRRRKAVTNPLWYRAERHPRRLGYIALNQLNQFRKFRRHYPVQAAAAQEYRGGPDTPAE